jgi:hypothetical protein
VHTCGMSAFTITQTMALESKLIPCQVLSCCAQVYSILTTRSQSGFCFMRHRTKLQSLWQRRSATSAVLVYERDALTYCSIVIRLILVTMCSRITGCSILCGNCGLPNDDAPDSLARAARKPDLSNVKAVMSDGRHPHLPPPRFPSSSSVRTIASVSTCLSLSPPSSPLKTTWNL